jgi:hypothetical protein
MPDEKGSSPVSPEKTIRPTRRMAAILGFLLKAEVDALFQQQPIETLEGADPLELWRVYDAKRQALTALVPQGVEPLPDSAGDLAEQIRRRKTYKEHYEAVAEYSLVLAPIETLLAPQWVADLDYIEEIKVQLRPEMSVEDLLRFAMSEGKITEPIIVGNQVLFTSPRRDLHADPIPTIRGTEDGEFEIIVRAASRPNYVQVVQIGQRLFLFNGVHKVCASYQMGFKKIPAVFRTAHNLAEIGVNPQSTSLFRQPVFESQRPALVTDFLGPETAVPIKMRSAYQILQVSVGVGTLTVPALPGPQLQVPDGPKGPGSERK